MSTYLLALANGEFVHLESSYKSPLSGIVRPLRIYGMFFYSLSAHLFLTSTSYLGRDWPGAVRARYQGKGPPALRAGIRYRVPAAEARHACC